jgi:DNA modification methylase
MRTARILVGDVRERLRDLPAQSVQTCVTSPPYWGLRNYGVEGQIGLERSPQAFVEAMVGVFAEVWRVLRDDGTCWIVIGDSYSGSGKGGNPDEGKQSTNKGSQSIGVLYGKTGDTARQAALTNVSRRWTAENGIRPKQLIGIPWRVAFALQAEGWYLRSDIIWSKPNPMPESVTDRPTKAHEYIFLLTKSERYYYDAEAIKEAVASVQPPRRFGRKEYENAQRESGHTGARAVALETGQGTEQSAGNHFGRVFGGELERNKRSVWHVATQPYPEAHFATYPEALIEPCILAGSRVDDTVLDPFCGSGTTGVVACRHNRHFIGVELNPQYAALAEKRITGDAALLNRVEVA